jgi:general stress protein 26
MKQVEISYKELERAMINKFAKLGSEGEYERAILSTSAEDHVTARKMRFIADGLTLYCYTIRNTRKYKQILMNPNVAVVVGYIQIDGVASIEGHPLEKKNADFIKVFQETQPEFYEGYKHVFHNPDRDAVLIKIAPKRIALLTYPDATTGRKEAGYDILNITKGEAYSVFDPHVLNENQSEAPAYWE